ncbi:MULTISPECIES: hypothetical protein [unclassified Leptolyngbya]|uniref:hypothetical protein n=1 Tax=unclassified Leptolyngbya TaxID=2650499 RepID=UPI0016841D5B|nr:MULTISPECIES: hypothetical protein [unclassified Leptolyngbya]MBD1914092.1 hypothetical protein [Leptolyngbya sp. FACHB-8]MBD2157311.1 hypothetical protein [Leptolyngbya sp. FACHB-16]
MSNLFIDIILPALLNGTVISLMVAIIVGTIVGFIVGIISHSLKKSIAKAIIGAFFGTLLVAVLPIFSKPEIMGSGPYGGITIVQMAIILVPLGSVGGALVGVLSKLKLNHPEHQKNLLLLLAVSYVLIAFITYGRITHYCQQLQLFQRIFPPEICRGSN